MKIDMDVLKKTILLAVLFGTPLFVRSAHAQATGSVTVSVTVVPGPGCSFQKSLQTRNQDGATGIVSKGNDGITLRSTSDIAVRVDSFNHEDEINLQQGQIKTFTREDLRGVKKIQITYLGS